MQTFLFEEGVTNVNCAKRHKQHTSLFWFGRCSVLAVLLTHPSLHRSDESSRKEQDVQEGVYPKHTASCSEHQRGLCRAPLWQHLSDRPRGGLGTTALDTLERDISDCARKDFRLKLEETLAELILNWSLVSEALDMMCCNAKEWRTATMWRIS